jgi:glycosyltransferase involved in cell wall biosynthesis
MFAHPGRHEAFGLALLEARAAGLPVVAMASGGVPDLIEHGRHGVLAGTRQEFCAAVNRLAGDDDLRARCAENASKDLDVYDWPQVVRQQESAYECARAAQSNVVRQRRSASAEPDATRRPRAAPPAATPGENRVRGPAGP